MPSKKKTRGKARRVAKNRTARTRREEDAANDVDSQMQRLQISQSTNNQDGADEDFDAMLEEAIKLASAEKEEVKVGTKISVKKCCHGFFPYAKGHVCMDAFINSYLGVYEGCNDSNIITSFARIYETTKVKWAEVWSDSEKLQLVVSEFLSLGTKAMIHEVDWVDGVCDFAQQAAAHVNFLEQWMAKMTIVENEASSIKASSNWVTFRVLCDWGKVYELLRADEHTLVSFFRKRIPCKCLDKRYEEVKSITKIGICHNPDCSLPDRKATRSKMLYCTHCRRTNYCSRECQVDHWQRHKSKCGFLRSLRIKEGMKM